MMKTIMRIIRGEKPEIKIQNINTRFDKARCFRMDLKEMKRTGILKED